MSITLNNEHGPKDIHETGSECSPGPTGLAVPFRELALFLTGMGGHQRALNQGHCVTRSVVDAISTAPRTPGNWLPSFSHAPSFSGRLPLAIQKPPYPEPSPSPPGRSPVNVWLLQGRPLQEASSLPEGGATLRHNSAPELRWGQAEAPPTCALSRIWTRPFPWEHAPKKSWRWSLWPRLCFWRSHPQQLCDSCPS